MEKQKESGPRPLPRVTWQQILREFQARTAPTKPRSIKIGSSIQEIASQIRQRQTPRFFGLIPEQAMLLGRFFPDIRELTITQANRIKDHEFDLIGSTPKKFDKEIDWHTDYIHNHTWPVQHQLRMKTESAKPADPRVPWSLSRFYHAVRLGQAYLYTQNEAYAQEIVDQIKHWIKGNPIGFGINWVDIKTVAIRAVNWVWAYYCMIESKALTEEFLALWLASIKEHGEHLLKHLPRRRPFTSQYLAALAGLAYLGIMFPEFPEAARWKSSALPKLWQQLVIQILPDGMHHEGSLADHCFVTELALSVAGLCIVNNVEIPETARSRIMAALDVIMVATQPNGLIPAIGDSSEDRFHILSAYTDASQTASDHRHLLALGSVVLERELSEWAGFVEPTKHGWSVGAEGEWQDAFWCFASDAAARYTDVLTRTVMKPPGIPDETWIDVRPGIRVRAKALARKPVSLNDVVESRYFEAGGLLVMRHFAFHLAVDGGSLGPDGKGARAHHGPLGITLMAHNKPFLIDPGTYQFDVEPAERNRFKSTAYHNTLQIGGVSNQSDDGKTPASTGEARLVVHHWQSQAEFDLFDATITGYAHLAPKITHRRQIWFDKVAHLWVIHDQLRRIADSEADPNKEFDISLWFHFAPMTVQVDEVTNSIKTAVKGGPNLILLPLGEFRLKASVEDGWVSPRYGVRESAPIGRFSGKIKLPADLIVMAYPYLVNVELPAVRTAGRAALMDFKRALAPLTALEKRKVTREP